MFNELGSIDIVLNDDGNTFIQQISNESFLVNEIVPDGIIVLEDNDSSYIKEFITRYVVKLMDYAY